MKKRTLYHLEEGEEGVVLLIKASGDMRRRLLDLGMIEGSLVTCLFKSPYEDPVAYGIRGSVIALRREDAMDILIKSEWF